MVKLRQYLSSVSSSRYKKPRLTGYVAHIPRYSRMTMQRDDVRTMLDNLCNQAIHNDTRCIRERSNRLGGKGQPDNSRKRPQDFSEILADYEVLDGGILVRMEGGANRRTRTARPYKLKNLKPGQNRQQLCKSGDNLYMTKEGQHNGHDSEKLSNSTKDSKLNSTYRT